MQFYREASERGEYVILDNSIIELGQPMATDELLRAIDLIHPTEFVCQDYPRDPATTHFWAMEKGAELKKRYPDMKLMVVPQWGQGKVFEDWWASFLWLRNLPFIDTIGLPKFIRGGRGVAAQRLEQDPMLRLDKEFHLLGTWGNPVEVRDMTRYKWIRGVDSKAPVRFGQYGIALHPAVGLLGGTALRDAVPALDFNNPDDPMPSITDHNVVTYLIWARGKKDADVLQFPTPPEEGFETKSKVFKGP